MVAQNSRCLLLDEPTSALDIAHQVEVLALIPFSPTRAMASSTRSRSS
jgi:ABC-type cobalamin/Fe3+-siderophores transport system ATPase subunit